MRFRVYWLNSRSMFFGIHELSIDHIAECGKIKGGSFDSHRCDFLETKRGL